MLRARERAQNKRQVRRTQFPRSPGSFDFFRQADGQPLVAWWWLCVTHTLLS
jgi:hypothetical protein